MNDKIIVKNMYQRVQFKILITTYYCRCQWLELSVMVTAHLVLQAQIAGKC